MIRSLMLVTTIGGLIPVALYAGDCRQFTTPCRSPVIVRQPHCAPVYAPAPIVPIVATSTVIVQENLAPAFVFQVLSAYAVPATPYTGQVKSYQSSGAIPLAAAPATQPTAYAAPGGPPSLSERDIDLIAQRVAVRLMAASAPTSLTALQGEPPSVYSGETQSKTQSNAIDEQTVLRTMDQMCASCHRSPNAKGGVTIFTDAGFLATKDGQPVSKRAITDAVASGRMPFGVSLDPNKRFPPAMVEWMQKNWNQ